MKGFYFEGFDNVHFMIKRRAPAFFNVFNMYVRVLT
ncbi:hypothetical protein C7422_102175 [Pantoea ananatis]|nr:hypothetical protein C7422_102175 [Pantoea ananatis]